MHDRSAECTRRSHAVVYSGDEVISFAQNVEDVLLHRAFRGKRTGFYIDIGAGDPNWDSVTRWFYTIGWRGINVEPNPLFEEIYARHRPDDINLNLGISRDFGNLTFYRVEANDLGQGWGLSSFDPSTPNRARNLGFTVTTSNIAVVPLQDIVDRYVRDEPVDFLKVDVEGYEREVFESVDWKAFRPAVVCAEAIRPHSAEPAYEEWEHILLSANYQLGIFDGVNNFYVRDDLRDVLGQVNAGVNCNDRFRKGTVSDCI